MILIFFQPTHVPAMDEIVLVLPVTFKDTNAHSIGAAQLSSKNEQRLGTLNCGES